MLGEKLSYFAANDATECNLLAISQSVEKLKGYFNNDDDSKKEGTWKETDHKMV